MLGASPHADRYSYLAVTRLVAHGYPVIALGLRPGAIGKVPIVQEMPDATRVHTVTLYLNPVNQMPWTKVILGLAPERIIFNPGTEHPSFEAEAAARGIEVVRGCTLVMLAAGTY